ncbi:probable arginine--tRNA ligase, mitochondrial [Chelonus insularis]|uniref:probable arginine--tRNA ligase, mitochondrial n=1 Tax=Chelonus insularis TaxID=460826 RepID=UPI00158E11E7|nr:probable arginine--tRNA ligase, mitochondrial [Chelonus insularis]
MSNRIRCLIQKKVTATFNIPKSAVFSHLYFHFDIKRKVFSFELPLKTRSFDVKVENIKSFQPASLKEESNNLIKDVCIKEKNNIHTLSIIMDRSNLVKEILESNISSVSPPSLSSEVEKVIVEFSSPNIAKPFHIGHLRSTIIGNYIANIHSYLNNNVIKLNYLGDWGTQLGLLQLGSDALNIDLKNLKINPLQELYRAYVHANKLLEADPSIQEQARKIFSKTEHGDTNFLEQWNLFKKYTIPQLEQIYKRLGVKFDEYHWESNYSLKNSPQTIELIKKSGVLKKDGERRQVVEIGERIIPIFKSDGSTLYLYRDIAAAIDRANKYNFDKMLYVVDNSQHDHFNCLFEILQRMKIPWVNKLQHIKFGKIYGMSTRQGTGIFLTDLLDEANNILKKKQLDSSKTKVIPDMNDNSSDILGLSAIIIYELKQRRQRDYKFSWDVALDMKGETGIKLQYTHCRLHNLKENCGVHLRKECNPSVLEEPIIDELISLICKFDDIILFSFETLEACYLAKYLFHLSHITNKALEQLRVKDQPEDIATQRLLLFQVAKNILNTGMKLLCLTPLNKM